MDSSPVSRTPASTTPISTEEQPPKRRSRLRRALSGIGVTVGLFLLKIKGLLFLLAAKFKWLAVNPFEGFGVAQFAVTGGSMIVTMVAYAVKMGKPFAIGFVLLTVIHEVGHALAIRAKGLHASAMVFIPFVGGAVTLKDQPTSVFDDAQIGLAGPIAGTLASVLSLYIYQATGRDLYLAIAFAGFLLNLFNLLPIGMLDGGRISAAISKWMWLFGGAVLLYVMILWTSPLLLVVLVLSVFQIRKSIQREKGGTFYDVTTAQRLTIAASYFLLILFLGYQTVATHHQLLALQRG